MMHASALPKTRSGKIMRRLLRKIATQETDKASLGDTSTLADESVVQTLIEAGNKWHTHEWKLMLHVLCSRG